MNYEDCIKSVLVSESDIAGAVDKIAAQITKDYANSKKKILLIGILKGSAVFMSDLMRKISLPLETDYIKVSSYGDDTVSSGKIKLKNEPDRKNLSDYNVIIIEDILDTGNTLAWVIEHMKNDLGAKELKLCVLFNKPQRRLKEIQIDYEGFVIPDEFIVGYGLDYDEMFRNLPYVGVLKPSVYENH